MKEIKTKKKVTQAIRDSETVVCGSLMESLERLPSSITNAKAGLESRSRSVQLLGLGP